MIERLSTLVNRVSNFQIVIWLTCFLFASQPFGELHDFKFRVVNLLIFGVIAFSEKVSRSAIIWAGISLYLALTLINEWHFADNHKYLMAYWALAITLSLWAKDEANILKVTARYLIGLTFIFATIWKFIGDEFLDGSFFYATIIFRDLFSGLAKIVTGLPIEELANIREQFNLLLSDPSSEISILAPVSENLYYFSLFSSYWIILLEGLIAITFLLGNRFCVRYRDLILIIFLGTTYFIAPVERFGMILAILGLAQADKAPMWVRSAYIILFFIVQLSGFFAGLVFRAVG